uniref:Uncharacterized protein n=1 Tax=Ditylenchus dipsaci TaxID=166011 RepID=A0A915E200_9BILA
MPFFGPSFSAALESTADRPLVWRRDICSENNEACFSVLGSVLLSSRLGITSLKAEWSVKLPRVASPSSTLRATPKIVWLKVSVLKVVTAAAMVMVRHSPLILFTKSALESLFEAR